MADTQFDCRGHVLRRFYLAQDPKFSHHEFIFSVGQKRKYSVGQTRMDEHWMRFFTFTEKMSRSQQTEYDYSMINDRGRKSPGYRILASRTGGEPSQLIMRGQTIELDDLIPKNGIQAQISASNLRGTDLVWVKLTLFGSGPGIWFSFKMKKVLGVDHLHQKDPSGIIIRPETRYMTLRDPWIIPKSADLNYGLNPVPH